MIDRSQFLRTDWQQIFEKTFAIKLDFNTKTQVNYSIELFEVTDTNQLHPRINLEFSINDKLNKLKNILFINRYNLSAGEKNLKIQVTTKCGKQLTVYPAFHKCYIEETLEVWTYKLTKTI